MMFFISLEKNDIRYKSIGYNLNDMRQSACLVFDPIMLDNHASFLNCTPLGRASDTKLYI